MAGTSFVWSDHGIIPLAAPGFAPRSASKNARLAAAAESGRDQLQAAPFGHAFALGQVGENLVRLESFWYFFRWYDPSQPGDPDQNRHARDAAEPYKAINDAGCLTQRGFLALKGMGMIDGEFEALLAECRAVPR